MKRVIILMILMGYIYEPSVIYAIEKKPDIKRLVGMAKSIGFDIGFSVGSACGMEVAMKLIESDGCWPRGKVHEELEKCKLEAKKEYKIK